jgi:hypothetical protein
MAVNFTAFMGWIIVDTGPLLAHSRHLLLQRTCSLSPQKADVAIGGRFVAAGRSFSTTLGTIEQTERGHQAAR